MEKNLNSIKEEFGEGDDSIGIIPNFNFSKESSIFNPKRDQVTQQIVNLGKKEKNHFNRNKKKPSINVNVINDQRESDWSDNELATKQTIQKKNKCKKVKYDYESNVCKSPISSSLIQSRRINIHGTEGTNLASSIAASKIAASKIATRNIDRTIRTVLGPRTLETYSVFSTYTYPVLFPLAFILQATLLYAIFNSIKGILPYGPYKRIIWISMYLTSIYIFLQGLSSFLAKCYGTNTKKDRPAKCIRGCCCIIGSGLGFYMIGCVAKQALTLNGQHEFISDEPYNISDIGSIGLLLIIGSVYYLLKQSNKN